MDLRRQFCFAMVIQALGKHILGSKEGPQVSKKNGRC